jgi:hypothetical protein
MMMMMMMMMMMTMMTMMTIVEYELAGETEVLVEDLPQYHFVHHKSRHGRKPATVRLAMARPHRDSYRQTWRK